MKKQWYKTFMTHSRTEPYRTKLEEANQIIKSVQGKAYVAFSGGKDSLCVLSLVSQIRGNIPVMHQDFGRQKVPYYLEKETEEIAYKFTTNYRVFKTMNDNLGASYKKLFGEIIPSYVKAGYEICFLGLRKEESSHRRIRIKNNINLSQIKEIYPIQNWSWLDVWAYIVSNNLPYLSIYDKYGDVLGWDKVRYSTFFQFERFGNQNIDGVLMWRFRNAK
jgi:FAD synthetase